MGYSVCGSWRVINGVISPLIWVITIIVTLLIAPHIAPHEPPKWSSTNRKQEEAMVGKDKPKVGTFRV